MLLLGRGRNGTGTLLGLVRALLGERNVSAVSLHALGEHRFAPAELQGKLANRCGDIGPRPVERTEAFKQLTGADPVFAERKHGQPVAFTSVARPRFGANRLPQTADRSAGWFARWPVVPMARRFAGEAADPDLPGKLTAPAELSGLLTLAVAGLRRLMARGRFDPPPSALAAEACRLHAATVRAFVADRCRLDPGARTKKPAVLQAYLAWCADERRSPEKRRVFYDRLGEGWPGQVTPRHQNDGDHVAGIRLADE